MPALVLAVIIPMYRLYRCRYAYIYHLYLYLYLYKCKYKSINAARWRAMCCYPMEKSPKKRKVRWSRRSM